MGRQDPNVPTHPLPILLPSLRWRYNSNQVKKTVKNQPQTFPPGVHLLVHKLHSGRLETQQVVESRPRHQPAPGNPPALLTHACHLLLTSTLLLLHLQLCPLSFPHLLIPLQLLPKERDRTKKVRTRRRLTKSNKSKRRGNQRMAKKKGRAATKTKTELNTI